MMDDKYSYVECMIGYKSGKYKVKREEHPIEEENDRI